MGEAKIRLSQKELELVSQADWILTKNTILQKVKELLGLLQQQQYLIVQASQLPVEISHCSPKISKGENYNGLPYLILDYPRYFNQENIFAIRTLFWWGNFFSVTLHLSGTFKKTMEQAVIHSYAGLKKNGFYYCRNNDPWEHHFEPTNYTGMNELNTTDFENGVRQQPFIKLAAKISLDQWDDAGEILLGYFKQLIKMPADQPPSR